MEDLRLLERNKLDITGDNASLILDVFLESNLCSKITSYIPNQIDRVSLSHTCSYFYNMIYGKPPGNRNSVFLKLHLEVKLYKELKKEDFRAVYLIEDLKNVIVFNLSDINIFIWDRYKEYKEMKEKNVNADTRVLFKKLQLWLMEHNQLISHITLSYEIGCKVDIYAELICLLFEKLHNVAKVTFNGNMFYAIATSYPDIVRKFSMNEKKIIIEIRGDKDDRGGITRRYRLLEWLTPDHHVEFSPTSYWSISSQNFGNPLRNMSVYKSFKMISNVRMCDVDMYFRDQEQLNEISLLCPSYEPPVSKFGLIESFKNVSILTFTCYHHYETCSFNVLSSFPMNARGDKNDNLKKIYIISDISVKKQNELLDFLTMKFTNIETLWVPIGSLFFGMDFLFKSFNRLTSICISQISREQMRNVITFAVTFSQKDQYVKTIAVHGNQLGYRMMIADALEIKKKFKYLFCDHEEVEFQDDKFKLYCRDEFINPRFLFLKNEKHIRCCFIMTNSVSDIEKFKKLY
uniref:F-box domain-containing protein n=1 Tax=Parastrongyloides trichosuri TaxID=131310 RepID=A0A0N4Z8X1_PARTI